MSNAIERYEGKLAEIGYLLYPNDDSMNIDLAVSSYLLTYSKDEEAEVLAESITQQDAEVLMACLRCYLDSERGDKEAIELAHIMGDQISHYLHDHVLSDGEYLCKQHDAMARDAA